MEFIWFPKEETLRSALVQRVVEKYEKLRAANS
jgi:hypothetical protein